MTGDEAITSQFGADGLRRFPAAALHEARLHAEDVRLLADIGVPVGVGPYFTATTAEDTPRLGAYAARHRLPAPPRELERWLRLGDDKHAQLCIRPDGAIQAVVLSEAIDDLYVSSSVAQFIHALALLDQALPRIAAADGMEEAVAVFRRLAEEMKQLDGPAFAERENWWPRVLDDVRHTLNFPFSASFEFVTAGGQKEIVTESTGPGRLHPEERLWQRLSASGIAPEQITRVYCELEPCVMPGHYCAMWMNELFPRARFTHSFPYGETAASREDGFRQLIVHAARGARGDG
ncbi:SUKH-4 family immunity protein [Streptomyces sp. NPDC006551]|uniref:SUKH-4 family immunity protein n=1 Tax=Streptomyces sp. NPDC006551 TaxID=3157178 RepID=UPI0033B5B74E